MSPIPNSESECDDNKLTEGEDLSNADLIIPPDLESTEEEDEDGQNNVYLGYIPLSQDPAENLTDSDENDHSDVTTQSSTITELAEGTGISHDNLHDTLSKDNLPLYLQAPDMPKTDKKNIIWNQARETSEIKMDPEVATTIKAAMAGFQLPPSNIPNWAKEISEDEWKEQLVSKISLDSLKSDHNKNSNADNLT